MKKPGKINYFYLIVFLVLILDQIVKFFIKKIELGKDVFDLGFFSLTHLNNYGAGFGILQDQTWIFIFAAVIFIFVFMLFYEKIEKDKLVQTGFALLLGGTISNLIDRLIHGFVIDYLNFKVWPVFNIADSAITVGAVIVVWYYAKKR